METFKIHYQFNKQDFIREHKLKWEIHWRKNRRQLITYSIISIFLLTAGKIASTEEEPANIYIFLGLGSTLTTILFIYFRLMSKQRFYRKIMDIAAKFEVLKMDCIYEFSDESVKYSDMEKTLDFKWTVFSNYSIYKNYLILVLSNSIIESFIFEKNESEIDVYNKILELAKSKLTFKEIK